MKDAMPNARAKAYELALHHVQEAVAVLSAAGLRHEDLDRTVSSLESSLIVEHEAEEYRGALASE